MSDGRLRELERRWRESGSVEDEVAYLRERLRVGELDPPRLEIAALCGHEAAMVAWTELDQTRLPSLPHTNGRRNQEWVEAFAANPSALTRATIGIARLVMPIVFAHLPQTEDPLELTQVIETWVLNPDFPGASLELTGLVTRLFESRDSVSAACLEAAQSTYPTAEWNGIRDQVAMNAVEAAYSVAFPLLCQEHLVVVLTVALEQARTALSADEALGDARNATTFANSDPGIARAVRSAVGAEVVPWALGYGDPIRERVEARQREAARE